MLAQTFAQGFHLFINTVPLALSLPSLRLVPASILVQDWLSSNWCFSHPDNKILVIVLALWHGIYIFSHKTWFFLPFPSLCGLTSQSHQQSRKPLSLLNGLTLWWKWLGMVRVCVRRVTDGINHHNNRVRGVERECWAVTDGTVRC